MIRVLISVFCLAVSLPAAAACTWSSTGSYRSKVVCTTANEAAPTLVTEGMSLSNLKALSVTAEADAAQTFTAAPAGTLAVYLWDPTVAAWARCRDCGEPTITEASVRRQSFAAFQVLGPTGRIAFVPVGVTVSAGGVTLYLTGSTGK